MEKEKKHRFSIAFTKEEYIRLMKMTEYMFKTNRISRPKPTEILREFFLGSYYNNLVQKGEIDDTLLVKE